MFLKLVSLIGVLILLAVSLLVLRQQRIELAHGIADRHRAVETHRHDIWDAQIRTAELTRPSDLRPRLDHTPLALEPAVEPPLRTTMEFAEGRPSGAADVTSGSGGTATR